MEGQHPNQREMLHLVGHQKSMSHSGKTQEKRLPDCLQMFFCHEKEETNSHLVSTCVWWAIWRERNLRCHENITNTIQKVKENCINMFFWCKEDGIEEVEHLVDFLGSM
ncbi:hypothetical protein H5410_047473 [Solanum commersonii]|uniref:Uncharacterized protein n=1 Tax=Solanum commersonii TaxID=4109 RepID=A0A9J5XHE6_SOLCO|nr:hypothetical protein H5410_047473 [Solanum commersonii]